MRKGMEAKLIKEENVEKESGVYIETPRSKSVKPHAKDRCKTPDSPEGARHATTPHSPPQASPPRNPNSPVNNGSADSLTPPLPASTILSVSLETPRSFSLEPQYGTFAGYASSKQMTKVKKFLSTLVQFGNDINQDVGERVKSLVLNLVSSNLSIEEFHHSLQDVTNFPLRPFVLPFLKAHLPVLQREIYNLARVNKQSTLQYVRAHDHVILESTHSPSEAAEIFMSNDSAQLTGMKRRTSEGMYENGINGQPSNEPNDYIPPTKRPTGNNSSLMFSHHQNMFLPNIGTSIPNSHLFEYTQQHPIPKLEDSATRGDEEWRNIHVMLNCILSMVEKTKRALTILQQRNSHDMTWDWLRKQDVNVDLKKAANEILAQAVRQTEERVADVKRRAEEAVNDVKRQAVIELQKAVAAAETKAKELVASERAKMEKLLTEAKKHPDDNSSTHPEFNDSSTNQPAASQPQNSCWNCGRKAHETCSGCSLARYCGSFCQHKDWENHHHQVCSKEKIKPVAVPTLNAHQESSSVISTQGEVKFKK